MWSWFNEHGYDVVREIIATSRDVREGVGSLLQVCRQQCPNPAWDRMARLDYAADVKAIGQWLERQLPISDAVEVLWFAFWDVTTGFNLRGSTKWSRDPENWDWWYEDDFRGQSYESPILVAMHTIAREVDDPQKRPRESGGVWDLAGNLLNLGYLGLAAAEVFRNTDSRLLLGGRDERWVVTGFPDAVYGIIVGRTTARGFEPFGFRKTGKASS